MRAPNTIVRNDIVISIYLIFQRIIYHQLKQCNIAITSL